MAHYLADTSAWNRSRHVVEHWGALLEANEIALCAPVRLELLYSARGPTDYRKFAFDLAQLPNIEIDRAATARAERTQALLAARSHHRGPAPVDLMIAAIAEVHGATLLHYDRHFDLIARVTGQPAEWLAKPGSLA